MDQRTLEARLQEMARRFVTKNPHRSQQQQQQQPQRTSDHGASNHNPVDDNRSIKQEPDAAQGAATTNALARETSSRDFFPSSSAMDDKSNVPIFPDNTAQATTNRGNGATFDDSTHHAAISNGMVMSNGVPLIRGSGGAHANVSRKGNFRFNLRLSLITLAGRLNAYGNGPCPCFCGSSSTS